MADINRIKLRGTVFTIKEYRDSRGNLLPLLASAHREGNRAKCLCGTNMPELYLVHRSGQYFLAKMPNTGSYHDVECDFYEPPEDQSGRGAYGVGAIVDLGDAFDIKLGVPLTRQRTGPVSSTDAVQVGGGQTRRNAVGLLGLVHFLWEQSRNNRWFPTVRGEQAGQRQWRSVHYFLRTACSKMRRKKAPLTDALYLIPEFDKSKVDVLNSAFTQFMLDVVSSGTEESASKGVPAVMKMMLGEVKTLAKSKYGYEMKVRGMATPFYVTDRVASRVMKSFKSGWDAVEGQDGEKSIVLAVVSASKKGNFNVEDFVLMAVNRNYIPYDSSYERRVADQLIAQQRLFEKPLRYDNEELTLPDFVLLDCEAAARVPMEVFGMTGYAAYDVRKEEKRRIYQRSNEPFWEWEPAAQSVMPTFPQRRPPRAEQ
jgi:hypothetical protein